MSSSTELHVDDVFQSLADTEGKTYLTIVDMTEVSNGYVTCYVDANTRVPLKQLTDQTKYKLIKSARLKEKEEEERVDYDKTYEEGYVHEWMLKFEKVMQPLFKADCLHDLTDWHKELMLFCDNSSIKPPAAKRVHPDDLSRVKGIIKRLSDFTHNLEHSLQLTGDYCKFRDVKYLRDLHLLYIELTRAYCLD